MFNFEGKTLTDAVKKTFEQRNTSITVNPKVFHSSFMGDEDKKAQWLGFTKKAKLTEAPASFEEVVAAVKVFLEPVVNSLAVRRAFRGTWTAPGPWGE